MRSEILPGTGEPQAFRRNSGAGHRLVEGTLLRTQRLRRVPSTTLRAVPLPVPGRS